MTTRAQQAGITFWNFMFMLIMASMLGLVGMKTLPIYLNFFTLRNAMDTLQQQAEVYDQTPDRLIDLIFRRLDINEVDNLVKPKDFKYEVDEVKGEKKITVNYEERRNVLYNADVAVRFEHTTVLKRK